MTKILNIPRVLKLFKYFVNLKGIKGVSFESVPHSLKNKIRIEKRKFYLIHKINKLIFYFYIQNISLKNVINRG